MGMKIFVTGLLGLTLIIWFSYLMLAMIGLAQGFSPVLRNGFYALMLSYPFAAVSYTYLLWKKDSFFGATYPFSLMVGLIFFAALWGVFENYKSKKIKIYQLDLLSLEIPVSFHQELPKNETWFKNSELLLSANERLRRRPFIDRRPNPDVITYNLLSADYNSMGGRKIPIHLRVSLFNQKIEIQSIKKYLYEIGQIGFHLDGVAGLSDINFQEIEPNLMYSDHVIFDPKNTIKPKLDTVHFILTDPIKHTRLFLSISKSSFSKEKAILFLKQVMSSIKPNHQLAQTYFESVATFVKNKESIQKTNFEMNLKSFNDQLNKHSLPPLVEAEKFIDVGRYFYKFGGDSDQIKITFAVRLGSKKLITKRTVSDPYTVGASAGLLDFPSTRADQIFSQTYSTENIYYPEKDSKPLDLDFIILESEKISKLKELNLPEITKPFVWQLSPTTNDSNLIQAKEKVDYRYQTQLLKIDNTLWVYLSFMGLRKSSDGQEEMFFWIASNEDSFYFSLNPKTGGAVTKEFLGKTLKFDIEPLNSGFISYY